MNEYNAVSVLESHGFSLNDLVDFCKSKYRIENSCLIFAGSIVDGLSNSESDIDLLLIAPEIQIREFSMIDQGMVADTYGLSGGRIQIAQCTFDQINTLISTVKSALDHSSGKLINLNLPEKRTLHRLVSGMCIYNRGLTQNIVNGLGNDTLAEYCMVMNSYEAEGALKDAKGEIDAGNIRSGFGMLQRVSLFLSMATLNELGETNQNPKWAVRLLQRYDNRISKIVMEHLLSGMFPSLEETSNRSMAEDIYSNLNDIYIAFKYRHPVHFTDKGSEIT